MKNNTDKIWLRYEFQLPESDNRDILIALLSDTSCLGIVEKDNFIEAFFKPGNEQIIEKQIQEIISNFPKASIGYSKSYIPNEDWHLNWQDQFQTLHISPGIVVYPHWEKYNGSEPIQIAIIPGMAFGTGTHATTQMALKLLEKYIRPGMSVLDAGCGSGILTIAALQSGARFVEAWDIDQDVEDNFREQMELNGIDGRFSLNIGDVTAHNQYHFDLVLSNIERKPNLALLENMQKHGKFPPCIFTGILKDEYVMFKTKVLNYGLSIIDELFQDEWVAIATE